MGYRDAGRHLISVLAFLGLFIALALPNRFDWISTSAFILLPLEFMVIGLLLLLPGRMGRALKALLALLLGVGILLRGADLVTHEIFARRFNLLFDLHLLADGSRLLNGVLGSFASVAVGLAMLLASALLCVMAFLLLGRVQHVLWAARPVAASVILALLVVWVGAKSAGWPRAQAFAWDQLVVHATDTVASVQDIRAFAQTVGDDPLADRAGESLFGRLRDKDVLIVFAESYGRALLEREPFAPSINAALESAERALAGEGMQMRSAFLTAPTVGGLSWLSHASLLSGAWVDSETRYKSLMVSDRPTLNRLFRRAGWRTVAAMPAISMAWPEGDYYGYDQIYHAHNFGYRGEPFNWVTMPDQYVWSAVHRRELEARNRSPVMAELALISSHAPWTPVATLVPWEQVGDGRVFDPQARSGPTPEQVWRDVDSIRDHYRRSIEYMLAVLVSYLQHHDNDDLVLLVLGDHPAAPMVSGDPDDRQVPVHLIARDPAVMDAVAHWQWQPGLRPDADAPVWRMDRVRDRFVDAFSLPGEELER